MHYHEYPTSDGFIDAWLVVGPQAIEVADLERFAGPDGKQAIARHYRSDAPGVNLPIVEWQHAGGDAGEVRWESRRCREDHFVDMSGFYHTVHYLRAWAYAELLAPAAGAATLTLTTNGPADVWLNGEHVHRHEHWHHQIPQSVSFAAELREGANTILVRFERVAERECPFAMALRVQEAAGGGAHPAAGGAARTAGQNGSPPPEDSPQGLVVRLPVATDRIGRRRNLERAFDLAYVEREVYQRGDEIEVRWPDTMTGAVGIVARLQTPQRRIFVEAQPEARAGARQSLGKAVQFHDGPYHAFLMPRPEEYYDMVVRVSRAIPLHVLKNTYSDAPYGDYEGRRHEALVDAAKREGHVYAEIAKMELGLWSKLDLRTVRESIDGINRRKDCSDFYLVGLLGALTRYGDDEQFPAELREELRECALGFKYWMGDPGEDAMCFWSENHQILFHACEVLAGQLFPDELFTNNGETGAWHRARGERHALSWLRKRAAGGFREWDSNCYFEHDALALTHLADLAEDDEVRELAAVVLDKLFFTMALNSFKGAFGSTHGRTYTPYIKGARLEPTSGLGRILWGMGAFNEHILGSVALACARSYELPPVIAGVATDARAEVWSRERHAGTLEEWCDRASGAWEVNKVTYKTPDGMLCSAQDYQPGARGYQQHIWQATLGYDAVVFVTHPPCLAEDNSHRPNYWHGNAVLPRVAQWYGTLIDVRNIPEGDWLGFTHAYFPTFAFDAHAVRDGWAFARKGDGYLALTAAGGVELVTRGDNAYRELRSVGRRNIWVCHMGSASRDGDFDAFQQRVLALETRLDAGALRARVATPRGETVEFGWEGPLVVDGAEQPLRGFPHYESFYCIAELGDETMAIVHGEDAVRLDFGPRGAGDQPPASDL